MTICIGLLLSFALLLPKAVQFTHVFEEHEHISCTEVTIHLHEKKKDCLICDFNFSTFNYQLRNELDLAAFETETNGYNLLSLGGGGSFDFNKVTLAVGLAVTNLTDETYIAHL